MSKSLKSGKSQTQEIDDSRKPADPRKSQNQKIEKSQNPGNRESPQIRKPLHLKKQRIWKTHKLWKSKNVKIQTIWNPRVTSVVKTRRRPNPTTGFLPRPRNAQTVKPTNSQNAETSDMQETRQPQMPGIWTCSSAHSGSQAFHEVVIYSLL